MIRFCHFCGGHIPEEVLKKSKKARFCKDACRVSDMNDRKEQRKTLRRSKGQCPTCGRKMPKQKQEGPITRVSEVTQ
jgi:hypothetical protein